MKKYQFTEAQKTAALANGKVRCYYNEEISEETITHKDEETGEETPETHPVYIYDVIDLDGPLTQAALVDALIRTRYSQSDVEAIIRHKMANSTGAAAEFREFNEFAEAMKVEATRILS